MAPVVAVYTEEAALGSLSQSCLKDLEEKDVVVVVDEKLEVGSLRLEVVGMALLWEQQVKGS